MQYPLCQILFVYIVSIDRAMHLIMFFLVFFFFISNGIPYCNHYVHAKNA